MAGCIAMGLPVGEQDVIQGNVAFLLNEGQHGFSQRVAAWCDRFDVGVSDLAGKFVVMESSPNLMNNKEIDIYCEKLGAVAGGLAMVVIDTFAKSTVGADDNSTKEMSQAIAGAYRIADRLRCVVVLIDHLGKDRSKGLRGAYAKFAGVDMVGVVVRHDESVSLVTDKMKDGEDGKRFLFDIEKVGLGGVPVLLPNSVSVLPKQSDWIKGYLELSGKTHRDLLSDKFCSDYGCDKSLFRSVLKRQKDAGNIVEIKNIVILVSDFDA